MSQTAHFPTSHQELSLYAYIPSSRQPQLLKILSGITGMAPEGFQNHHLLYKPKRPKSGPGAADLFYIQLVSHIGEAGSSSSYNPRMQRWSMRLEDLPEVTRKPVISRGVYSANTALGDVLEFMDSLGYTLQAPYFTDNLRFIHNNVVITLTQTLVPPGPISASGQAAEARAGKGDEAFGTPWPREALRHVDPEKGWAMQAAVRVQSNTDVENVNLGVKELRDLREVLKGVCELEVVERLALDTRVR